MTSSYFNRRIPRLGLVALALMTGLGMCGAAERKLEARLIWGTNEEKSPDASHKKLDGELAKKLGEIAGLASQLGGGSKRV